MSRKAKKDSNILPPFVPATEWTQMLNEFRSKRGQKGVERRAECKGERKPALSLITTNPEHATTFNSFRIDSDFRVIVQNLSSDAHASTPLLSDDVFVSIAADITDTCFADMQFVREGIVGQNAAGRLRGISVGPVADASAEPPSADQQIELAGATDDDSHDLELDLLDNLQEISRYLCKTTARRTSSVSTPSKTADGE